MLRVSFPFVFPNYSLVCNRTGLPLHNIPFQRYIIMKRSEFLRPDVNHMRGIQYQIVLNITSG